MPLNRLLIETDCPYLAPHPYRGKRNEPAYVKLVAKEIAELKEITIEEVSQATTANAKGYSALNDNKRCLTVRQDCLIIIQVVKFYKTLLPHMMALSISLSFLFANTCA